MTRIPDLIGCYETVRAQPDEVARELELLAAAHVRDGRTQYYLVRDEQFNPMRDRLRGDDGRIAYTPQLAAMLIYLNRTGFNGLFRVNARGAFNVPAGRYDRPRIADRGKLTRVADALSSPRLTLQSDGSFESIEHIARPGDFVLARSALRSFSRTASFTSYTGPGFSADDQERLQRLSHRPRGTRLLRVAEQLHGGRNCDALRAKRRHARSGSTGHSRVPPGGRSTATPPGGDRSRNMLITNVVP